eukprot:CAMPEP_0182422158 /NCGR_PEP_ID=MMETSP1167-20130531/7758_1 /TAXON_ID=2988 /ORGANISM="Mallomonas Sp, Strain CCMP3275" /LENGTH=133 /DNA_ID=CAMNT_0024599955 /DNA_START=87 /DNA_END=488 /DNA_ORIENTATION=-
MPASKKILRNKQHAENRAAGIGDAEGRIPSRVKKEEVSAICTICSTSLRMTARNIEAKQHFESKHPTSTFAACFPGQFDPTAVVIAATSEESKDKEAKSAASAAPAKSAAPKKKKEDLSFLDAALLPASNKKK